MRLLALCVSLGVTLGASPAFAQAAAPRPAAPAAQAPRPAAAAPAPQAAPPAQATPAPVFPAGSKVAYINLQLLASLSADGKNAASRFEAEQKKKMAEAEAKASKMKSDQQRLETSGSVMSADARAALEKDIERQQRDGERYEQDAQAELDDLQERLQADYNRKLLPVLDKLAKDLSLQFLYSASDAGLIWADPNLDLTIEAVKRLDAAPAPAAAATPTPASGAKPTTAAPAR